jgi:hypothetical protein
LRRQASTSGACRPQVSCASMIWSAYGGGGWPWRCRSGPGRTKGSAGRAEPHRSPWRETGISAGRVIYPGFRCALKPLRCNFIRPYADYPKTRRQG